MFGPIAITFSQPYKDWLAAQSRSTRIIASTVSDVLAEESKFLGSEKQFHRQHSHRTGVYSRCESNFKITVATVPLLVAP